MTRPAVGDTATRTLTLTPDHVEKFAQITPLLARAFGAEQPPAGFYHWLRVADDDLSFARELFVTENITVLPGSFISRDNAGHNPGRGHIRVAWVADLPTSLDAARRLANHRGPSA